jgi:hypothetical protein
MKNAFLYQPFVVTTGNEDISKRKQLRLGHKGRVVENLVIIKTHAHIKINGKKTVKFISDITPSPQKRT